MYKQSQTEWFCVLIHACTDRLAVRDLFAYSRNFKRFRQEIRDICIKLTANQSMVFLADTNDSTLYSEVYLLYCVSLGKTIPSKTRD